MRKRETVCEGIGHLVFCGGREFVLCISGCVCVVGCSFRCVWVDDKAGRMLLVLNWFCWSV